MPKEKKKQLPPGLLSDPPPVEHQKIQLERVDALYGNGGVGRIPTEVPVAPVSNLPQVGLSIAQGQQDAADYMARDKALNNPIMPKPTLSEEAWEAIQERLYRVPKRYWAEQFQGLLGSP